MLEQGWLAIAYLLTLAFPPFLVLGDQYQAGTMRPLSDPGPKIVSRTLKKVPSHRLSVLPRKRLPKPLFRLTEDNHSLAL